MWLMDGTNATFVGAVGPEPGADRRRGRFQRRREGRHSLAERQRLAVNLDHGRHAWSPVLARLLSLRAKSEGPGSGLYALESRRATDTDGIGQGDEILLYVSADGTTVTGSTAATEADITAAKTAISRSRSTTIRRARRLGGCDVQPDAEHLARRHQRIPDDPEALTTAAAGDLTLTLTVTDADGDTDSASINLGAGVFVIQDDGPNAVVIGTPAAIVLDETRPLGRIRLAAFRRLVLRRRPRTSQRTLRRRTSYRWC